MMIFGQSRSLQLRKVFASALPEGRRASSTFLSNFVLLVGEEVHHSFILGMKHGNESMMLFRQSRSLHLRKVFDTFFKLVFGVGENCIIDYSCVLIDEKYIIVIFAK